MRAIDREIVVLTYDANHGVQIKPGQYIKTMTRRRGSSLYKVKTARAVFHRTYREQQRWVLVCEVLGRNVIDVKVPEGAVLHPLYWYSRKKKRVTFEQHMRRIV